MNRQKSDDAFSRVKEITDQLEQGVKELFESQKYKDYLTTMSKFHSYSHNNIMLIFQQKPDASLIAGYNAWKTEHGRQVRKGAKAIRILAPAPYKVKVSRDKVNPDTDKPVLDENGNPVKENVIVQQLAFKVVNVFDVSDTEGRELPSVGVNELSGDVERYEDFLGALKNICPVPIEFDTISSGAKGYFSLAENRIVINKGMQQVQTIKTVIHEISHQRLHSEGSPEFENKSRNSKEVEAESVAFTVCQHYGIDTSDYSFAYIAGWSKGRELSELKKSLDTIRKTASEVINKIDGYMEELIKDRTTLSEKTEKTSVLGKLYTNNEIVRSRISDNQEQNQANRRQERS